MKQLKVGIIGTGFIAGTAHMPSLMELGDKVKVVALADNRPDAVEYMAKRYGVEKTYTDPYKMLAENEFDLVHITTANNTHKEFSIAALRAGANVLCEKPLALTLADAKEMFAEADKAGKKLIAVQNNRMGPMQEVKRLYEEGVLGEVYYTEISNLRRRGVPPWGRFHTFEDNGAGPLCDVGVHYLDATLFALGNPKMVSVSANTYAKIAPYTPLSDLDTRGAMMGDQPYLPRFDYDYRDFSVEDFASGIVRFENGMQMALKFSWAFNLTGFDGYKLAGTKAGLIYDKGSGLNDPISLITEENGLLVNKTLQVPCARRGAMKDIGHRALIKHVTEVINGEAECLIKREEMLNVVATMEAFYLSSKLGKEVLMSDIDK